MSHVFYRHLSIKLNTLEDLVRISSIFHSIIYCQKKKGKYVYFTFDKSGGLIIAYYVLTDKPVEYKYSVYNGMDDTVSFTNEIVLDPKVKQIPIINIADQNIIIVSEEDTSI